MGNISELERGFHLVAFSKWGSLKKPDQGIS
jgi:hypothetical protein